MDAEEEVKSIATQREEEVLRDLIERTRADVSRLEASVADDRAAHSMESVGVWQKLESFVATIGDQVLQPFADVEKRFAFQITEERNVRAAQMRELRQDYLQAVSSLSSSAVANSSSSASASASRDRPATSDCGDDRMVVVESQLRAVLHELSPLNTRVGVVEAELRKFMRDFSPLHSGLEAMRAEVEALKMHLAAPSPSPSQKGALAVAVTPPRISDIPRAPRSAGSTDSCSVGRSSRSCGHATAALAQVPAMDRFLGSPIANGNAVSPVAAPPPLPALSEDMRQSLENVVHKVGHTLQYGSGKRQPLVQAAATPDSQRPPLRSLEEEARLNASAGQRPDLPTRSEGGSLSASVRSVGSVTLPANVVELQKTVNADITQALKAVQELRERNVSIREENIELVVRQKEAELAATGLTGSIDLAPAGSYVLPGAAPVPGAAAVVAQQQAEAAWIRRTVSPVRADRVTSPERQRVPSPARQRLLSPTRQRAMSPVRGVSPVRPQVVQRGVPGQALTAPGQVFWVHSPPQQPSV